MFFDSYISGQHSFAYILGRTMMRPRDLIGFLRQCVSVAINRGSSKVLEADILQAEKQYSEDQLQADFGILKWSTSAVCFGPPWAQQTSTLDLSVSLDLEAGVGLESQGGAIRADSVGI